MAHVGERSRQSADALVLLRTVNGRRADHQRASTYRLNPFQDGRERGARLLGLDAQPAAFDCRVVGAERQHNSRVGARQEPRERLGTPARRDLLRSLPSDAKVVGRQRKPLSEGSSHDTRDPTLSARVAHASDKRIAEEKRTQIARLSVHRRRV